MQISIPEKIIEEPKESLEKKNVLAKKCDEIRRLTRYCSDLFFIHSKAVTNSIATYSCSISPNVTYDVNFTCQGGRGVGVQGAADSPHTEDGPLQPGGAQAGLAIKNPPKKTPKNTPK